MARPPFSPDPDQGFLMRALTRRAERLAREDIEFSRMMRTARDGGVPIEHIAKASGVTVKTVYNRLARLEDSDQAPTPALSMP